MPISNWRVGETKRISVHITYNDTVPDVSSDTVTMYLRANRDDAVGSAVVTVTGDVVSEGEAGIIGIVVSDSDTSSLTPGKYWYNIKWTRANGDVYMLDVGTVWLKPSIGV